MMKRREILLSGAAALAAAPMLGRAQPAGTFPSRVIRMVPFGTAGGPIDTLARVYADKLQARWGQPVVIDAKPGASGIIAADFVAKAPADGHTVIFTLPLTHVNVPIMQKTPYDPFTDFTALSMVATGGPMIVGRADSPYNNVQDLIAGSKGGKRLHYGTWGNGSAAHLFGELLTRQTGLDMVHVPYKAEAAAHNDLFGGQLDFAWSNPSTARGHVQAGKMKAWGVAGSRRTPGMPEVPTFAEQGYKGFDVDSWIGVFGPANLPQPVQDAWVTALREVTAMPDIQQRLLSYGFSPLGNTPAQFRQIFKDDYPRVGELIKAAGVTGPQ